MEELKMIQPEINHATSFKEKPAAATPPAIRAVMPIPITDNKPKLLTQLSQAMRSRHYSRSTESTYVHWIKRFIFFHHVRHPQEMAEPEINVFLTHLAVKENVSASTQNQALCAIVFLYKHVINRKIGDIGEVIRARKPVRLPVVMTKDEVKAVLSNLTDGTTLYRDDGYIIITRDPDGLPPKEPRHNRVSAVRIKVFTNLLTFATNKFIESDIFTLDPVTILPKEGVELLVAYPDGTSCKIRCNDSGYGEVGINILYGIKCDNPPMYTFVSKDSKEICSAHATGWLERREGKYLQVPLGTTSIELYCEKNICKQ
jgi:hypothetical protein